MHQLESSRPLFFIPWTLKVLVLKPTPLRELKGAACWVPIVKFDTQVGLAVKPKG